MDDRMWGQIDPAREAEAASAFSARVMARVRAEAKPGPGWLATPLSLRGAPLGARVLAVLALVTGLAAGIGLAGWAAPSNVATEGEIALAFGGGLGEGYWVAAESEDPSAWGLEPVETPALAWPSAAAETATP